MQTLIVDLGRSLDEPQDSANLQIAVLSFFNALINYKAGQVSGRAPGGLHNLHQLSAASTTHAASQKRLCNISCLNPWP